jgi:hypothetical protein
VAVPNKRETDDELNINLPIDNGDERSASAAIQEKPSLKSYHGAAVWLGLERGNHASRRYGTIFAE